MASGSKAQRYQPGDLIFYAGSTKRAGSYADYQLVDERITALAPTNISLAQVAAMPLTWLTAYEILVDKLGYLPQKNHNKGRILIINGAGGAGSILIQLAKWLGLEVLATSSPQNFNWLKQQGADVTIDYHQDIVQQIHEAHYRNVDHVINLFDTVSYFAVAQEIVRPFGHIVNVSRATAPIDINVLQDKSISLDWELMFTKTTFDYELTSQGKALELLAELLFKGEIKSTLTKSVSGKLSAKMIQKLHDIMSQTTMTGKLVFEFA